LKSKLTVSVVSVMFMFGSLLGLVTVASAPAAADNVSGCIDAHWNFTPRKAYFAFYNSVQNRPPTPISCEWSFTTTCQRPNLSKYNIHRNVTIGKRGEPTRFIVIDCGLNRVVKRSVLTFPTFG